MVFLEEREEKEKAIMFYKQEFSEQFEEIEKVLGIKHMGYWIVGIRETIEETYCIQCGKRTNGSLCYCNCEERMGYDA